ncbi:MAG TPA: hypothetical protein VFE30_17625 [Anaeromyxobacteraceae bacterium]|nr:hypothetical protein [Anaeromyxobacteraceae bacterium]
MPLPLAACLALSGFVCAETLVANALSLFHAVSWAGLLFAHLALLGGVLGVTPRRFLHDSRRLFRLLRPRSPIRWAVLSPLAALAALSAGRFVPNNWDSMTYHLARVAHWLAYRSVAAYSTGIPRQNACAAGPEYLLLLLQGVSRSDRLAPFLQLFAWVLVTLATPALARLAGAPKRAAWLAGVFAGAAPMAVLQASSTQTDLVASVGALALVTAALPFLHGAPGARGLNPEQRGARARRVRGEDVVLVGVALAAAPLVKVSALFATLPLLLVGLAVSLRRLRQGARLPLAWTAAAVSGMALVVAPEILRRNPARDTPGDVAFHSYLAGGEWADRLVNVGRGLSHHLWSSFTLLPHEDAAGNPLQVVIFLVALGAAALAGNRLPKRLRSALLMVVSGWMLLHLMLRDNVWFSRVQLPLFVLGSVAVGALPGVRGRGVQVGLAAALLGFGLWIGAQNQIRPPFGPANAEPEWDYFASRPGYAEPELGALETVVGSGCARLGLLLGGDSYDYPLTWIGARLGIEARHVKPGDGWACAVFSDGEKPGPGFAPAFLARDEQTGSPRTFLYLRLPAVAITPPTAGSASR